MNGSRPATDSSLLTRLRFLRPWNVAVSWLAWLLSVTILALNPQASSTAVLLLIAAFVLSLAVSSVIVLALAYHRFLATWPGIVGLIVMWALVLGGAGELSDKGPALSGVSTLMQLSLPVAYLVSVSTFLWKRDISIALLAGLASIGVWMAAIAVVRSRGPANLLIGYLSASGVSDFWWWSITALVFLCALPPIVVGFCAHLLRLLYLEWRRE